MKNGDLILLDFTAKVKDAGDLIETTIEEEGKKIGEFDEDFVFKPRLVAVGASCAFLSPIGHQCNTLVMAPGNYKFGDYWRLGLPLECVIVAISIPMILFVWT